jgi:nucleotidyltransferase substrate binding protein (TIGR01987 family)
MDSTMVLSSLEFTHLEKTLHSLQSALIHPPKNDLERDGVIQRFEYTFELCWKSIRKLLLSQGRNEVSGSPKPLLRDALEEGLIDNLELWFNFLEARNHIAHTYNEKQAQQVYQYAQSFAPHAEALLIQLNKKLNSLKK